MANTLRFKRGLVATIPTALAGEPLFTTDTFDLYIGNGTTNTRFQKYIASGTTSQLLRGDGSLLTMPIVLTSPANGQVLKYNGTSWVNDSDAGITGSGSAGQVAYFTGATTQSGSNNLFWDATNSRLGVGTNTPSFPLHVSGVTYITGNVNIGSSSQQKVTQFGGGATGLTITSATYPILSLWDTGDTNWNFMLGMNDGLAYIWNQANSAITFSTNATERMRLHAGGNLHLGGTSDNGLRFQVTGDGFFSGSVGIGSSTLTATNLLVGKNISGATVSYGILQNGQVQSSVPFPLGITNIPSIAASLTITAYRSFYTGNPSIGAGSTISELVGYHVESNFVGGTSTYAFQSAIPAGTGRWNLYMNGTAANYLNGDTGIGTNNIFGGVKLQVSGVAFVNNSGNINYVLNSTGSHYGFIQNDAANKWSLSSGTSLTGGLGTAALTWFSTGNVSVGTTTDAGFKLDVNGTMRVSGNSTFGTLGTDTGMFWNNSNNRLGIRTNSPSNALTVAGDIEIRNSGATGSAQVNTLKIGTYVDSTLGSSISTSTNYGATTNTDLRFSTSTGGAINERMRLDASGNLGLGVTPSAWRNIFNAFQVGYTGALYGLTVSNATEQINLASNYYQNSAGNELRIQAGFATRYQQSSGEHRWATAATSTANSGITFTQAMTLDASGRLGIGTPSPSARLEVSGGRTYLGSSDGYELAFTRTNNYFYIYNDGGGLSGKLTFTTSTGITEPILTLTQNTRNVIVGGTTDAGFKLDVNGTMRVSGASTFSSSVTAASGTFASTNYTNAFFNGTNTSGWGNNIAFQSQGTDFGYVGSLGSLVGNTTKDMTIWSTAGNGFRVYTNGNNLRLQIDSAGAATFSSSVTAASLTAVSTAAMPLLVERTTANSNIGIQYKNATNSWYAGQADNGNFAISTLITLSLGEFQIARTGAATFSSSVTATSYNATTQNIFSVGGTEGMRLTATNRNLHIGTFSSDSGEKLQVVGTAKIGTYSTTGYSLVVQNNGANDVSGIRISTGATVDGYLSLAYDATNTYGSIQAGDNNVFRNIVLNRQGGSVGVGANPNNSAVLQADSTTRGFLPPRMTTTQRNAIPTPAAGLVVYDTTTNKLCCYNGTTWNDLF